MPSLAVPPARSTPALRALSAFLAGMPPKAYAGAALAAIALAIVGNATLLQRGRPVQAPAIEPAAAVKAPAPAVALQAPAAVEPAAPAPAVQPPARAASPAAAVPAAALNDPIADLLSGAGPAKDDHKLVVSAQVALVKLGYSVKVDGEADAATQQALADFRKKHGLAAGGPIDAKLVKALNAAAR